MSKNNNATYDSRKYDCCAPYYGDIGEEFTRRFKPEFEGALHMFVDQYASLYDHVVLRNDPGSAAAPLAAAAAAAPARLAFALRQKRSYGIIRKHVEDPAIRDAIDATAMGDGPAAWALINQMCSRPQTYLNLADQDKEWNDASLHDVGISERTVENFRALLERINRERPVAQIRSNVQVWQKLLESIGSAGNPELKTMVRNELQVPSMIYPAGHPLVGEPDIHQYVQRFSERWRVLIHDGTIKQAPARRRNPPAGNRVDAMMVKASTPSDSTATFTPAFAASSTQHEQLERMCWNCRGLGHTKVDSANKMICPSPVKTRSITSAIAALETYRRREAGRGGRRKMFVKRPNTTSAKSAQVDEYVEVLVDDDGGVYSTEGVYMGNVVDLGTPELAESDVIESQTESAAAAHISERDTADGERQTQSRVIMHTASDDLLKNDHQIDECFTTSFIPQACIQMAETNFDADTLETDDLHRQTSNGSKRRPILLLAGSMALMAAMAAPRGVSRMLIMLGMASLIAASPNEIAIVSVHQTLLADNTDPNAQALNSRTGAAIDTGASMHVSGRVDLFPKELVSDHNPLIKVQIANDVKCEVRLKGTIRLPVRYRTAISSTSTSVGYLHLNNALLVPELRDNTLLSPRAMFHEHGIRTYFNDDRFLRLPRGQLIDFVETSTLYVLPFAKTSSKDAKVLKSAHTPTADEIHSRCMHFSIDKIKRSLDCLDNAQFIAEQLKSDACKSCGTANARKHDAHELKSPKFNRAGDCVCSDTCDMGEYSTPFGFRYFLTFLDMATRYLWVYFLRTHEHAEVRASYKQFLADAAHYFDRGAPKLWYMDNGSEFNVSAGVGKDKPGFFANDTDAWLSEYFTRRRFIVPWHPNQNPAESMNRILLRPARAALHAAGVPTRFWPFAIHQAAIVHNVLATVSLTATHVRLITSMLVELFSSPQNRPAAPQSPYLMLHKRRFDFDLLHTLFCMCECVIRNPVDLANRPKAASRSTKAVHLGLDLRRAGYFVYLIEYQRFTTSAIKDTVFHHESNFPNMGPFIGGEVRQGNDAARLLNEEQQISDRRLPEYADRETTEPPEDRMDRHESTDTSAGPPSQRTRSRVRERDALICHNTMVPYGFVVVASDCEHALAVKKDIWRPIQCPMTPREAMAQDSIGWTEAYVQDFKAKLANGAFEFVPRTDDMIVHKCTWAHKLVWNDDNTLSEKRARLVGCGYSQVQGRDYASSYSGTPKSTAVRMFLAAVAVFNLEDEHCDVVKAFTQNDITDAVLHVQQPPYIPPLKDRGGKPMVMRVLKALEGFKQSGHLHQINHTNTFTENDLIKFTLTDSEPTLLTYVDGDIRIMALVWTDDVLFAYSVQAAELYERFLHEVYGRRWNYKRKGSVSKFVGIDIRRDRTCKSITLSLEKYIEGIYSNFVQSGHPGRTAPYKSAEQVKLIATAKTDVDRQRTADKPYLAAVASCLWVYTMLRADVSLILNVLCGVMHDPSEAAWVAVVDLISYLYHTRHLKITYTADRESWILPAQIESHRVNALSMYGLHGWVDASWKLPSVAGYIFIMAGGPIEWSSKNIKVICHSSAEAETSAGCMAAKSSMYIRNVANAVGLSIQGRITIMIDSEAAIAISSNLGVTKRTAHFLRWQFYLRWCLQHCYIQLSFVSGKRQIADALTKPVDISLLREFRTLVYGS